MDATKAKALNYKIVLVPCEEGGYFVSIPDLPGCMSQGENVEEAVLMIEDAKAAWLEAAEKRGIRIPYPGEHQARQQTIYSSQKLLGEIKKNLEKFPDGTEPYSQAA